LIYAWGTAANTPLNINVRWMDAIANPVALGCLALVTLIIVLSFGVHYGSVGSWLPQSRKWATARSASAGRIV
jgi:hypothetical protein